MNRQKIAQELVAVAKELTAAKKRKATWSFSVPVKLSFGDIEADYRKVANDLKKGNVHIDIAEAIKRVVERNGISLVRGNVEHAQKDFHIKLSYSDGELEVQVD